MNIKNGLFLLPIRYMEHLPDTQKIKKEVLRKSLHISISFAPFFASLIGKYNMALVLAGCALFYFITEVLRIKNINIPIITNITNMSRRSRDHEDKVTLGPLTLAIGSILCLVFLPLQYATIGILALAFGDGLASLVGIMFGITKTLFGKSLEGSLACFLGVFFSSYATTNSLASSLSLAILITLIELLPLKDFDNIVIPVFAGLFMLFFDFATLVTQLVLFI